MGDNITTDTEVVCQMKGREIMQNIYSVLIFAAFLALSMIAFGEDT